MTKKNIKRLAIILAIFFLLWLLKGIIGGPPPKPPVKTHQNQNITLFIDLSDHLDETISNGQGIANGKERWENFIVFTEIFGEIYTEVLMDSRRKLSSYDEKIHISAHPTATFPLVDQYLIDLILDRNTLETDFNIIENQDVIKSKLVESITGIVEDSRNTFLGKDWPGCNLFDYFKKKTFYNPDDQNLLIIYTDGYPYHYDVQDKVGQWFLPCSPPWKKGLRNLDQNQIEEKFQEDSTLGMIPATADLEYLRVLVVGAKSQTRRCENDYENELLEFIWSDWLQKMGVKPDNFKMIFMDADSRTVRTAYKWLINTPWEID